LSAKFYSSELYLVRKLRKGDCESFELIFNNYKEKLYFFARGYLHSDSETEEIIQNVFVSLWENRDLLNEELSIKDYLYKAVVNKVFNYFKHQAVRQKYLEHILIHESEEDNDSQLDISYNDLKDAVNDIVEHLPSRQKEIFRLSREEGLSHNDIASKLGLSVRSVENNVYRALKYIKENLSKEYSI
jgi:RNA polymerase sigma-70 factor, ECF subfamily